MALERNISMELLDIGGNKKALFIMAMEYNTLVLMEAWWNLDKWSKIWFKGMELKEV
jgi:hypothetical protein